MGSSPQKYKKFNERWTETSSCLLQRDDQEGTCLQHTNSGLESSSPLNNSYLSGWHLQLRSLPSDNKSPVLSKLLHGDSCWPIPQEGYGHPVGTDTTRASCWGTGRSHFWTAAILRLDVISRISDQGSFGFVLIHHHHNSKPFHHFLLLFDFRGNSGIS